MRRTFEIIMENEDEYKKMLNSGGSSAKKMPLLFTKWYSEEELKKEIDIIEEFYLENDYLEGIIAIKDIKKKLFGDEE